MLAENTIPRDHYPTKYSTERSIYDKHVRNAPYMSRSEGTIPTDPQSHRIDQNSITEQVFELLNTFSQVNTIIISI